MPQREERLKRLRANPYVCSNCDTMYKEKHQCEQHIKANKKCMNVDGVKVENFSKMIYPKRLCVCSLCHLREENKMKNQKSVVNGNNSI